MRFTGMVEVEFKRDPRTGSNLLLDVNPRAWGWQSLGGRAGVDFPFLLWRLATGEPSSADARGGRRALGAHREPTCSRSPASSRRAALAARLRCARCAARSSSPSSRRDDPLPSLVGPLLTARVWSPAGWPPAGRCRRLRWRRR